jgi:two-component system sensor histidine kinase KdpD
MKPRSYVALVPWVGWLGALVALTVAFLPLRERLDRVHVAFAFLLVVLGGSATGGRALGLALTLLAYLGFHYFFIEHFDSLAMGNPFDGIVLVAFLVTSLVASHLVTRARAEALAARHRAAEVERLASLGAETLSAGRAEDALRSVLDVIRASTGVDDCRIVDAVAGVGAPQAADPRTLRIPVTARGHASGTLVLTHHAPIVLTSEQRRFLEALAHYAALAAERVRLVSDAERAEAARKTDALRASLVAGLSHDLRTPLTTIKALANRLNAPEAASIEREADRLNRLAGDLLDLSRLNAGAMPLRRELNTAADLVGAALQRVDEAHPSARVRVVPFDDENAEPLTGHFDFVQSLRALVNLIENALKYSRGSEAIELRVTRESGKLAFHISDRGPGVAGAERDLVFEPFYRAPGTPVDTGGAGLGLAIARRLAREQGGDVRYEDRQGGGSVFTLTVPSSPD